MVNAATREKMAGLEEELEQMRIKMARIDKASEAAADVSPQPSRRCLRFRGSLTDIFARGFVGVFLRDFL